MKKIKLLCICITIAGVILFVCACTIIPANLAYYPWSIGLASALIILGLGYLINVQLAGNENSGNVNPGLIVQELHASSVKEKSGFLVCKIMNLVLCVYLFIINQLSPQAIIMLLGISVLLIQYLLDLFLQLYLLSKKKDEDDM